MTAKSHPTTSAKSIAVMVPVIAFPQERATAIFVRSTPCIIDPKRFIVFPGTRANAPAQMIETIPVTIAKLRETLFAFKRLFMVYLLHLGAFDEINKLYLCFVRCRVMAKEIIPVTASCKSGLRPMPKRRGMDSLYDQRPRERLMISTRIASSSAPKIKRPYSV